MEKKVAYCILAHSANEQLRYLINTLTSDHRSLVYLHLDAKSFLPEDFVTLEQAGKIRLVDRVRVNWGGFNMIVATRNLLEKALEEKAVVSFSLLSGSCFPLRTMKEINDLLAGGETDCFALWDIISDPDKGVGHSATSSVEKRYFMDVEFLSPTRHKLNRAFFKVTRWCNNLLPYRRRPPKTIVKGSQWFVAGRQSVLHFTAAHQALESFLRPSFAPDETYFQTLFWHQELDNGRAVEFIEQRQNLQGAHFIAYHPLQTGSIGQGDRRVVTEDDMALAMSSSAIFARKCSPERCKAIANCLGTGQG